MTRAKPYQRYFQISRLRTSERDPAFRIAESSNINRSLRVARLTSLSQQLHLLDCAKVLDQGAVIALTSVRFEYCELLLGSEIEPPVNCPGGTQVHTRRGAVYARGQFEAWGFKVPSPLTANIYTALHTLYLGLHISLVTVPIYDTNV